MCYVLTIVDLVMRLAEPASSDLMCTMIYKLQRSILVSSMLIGHKCSAVIANAK